MDRNGRLTLAITDGMLGTLWGAAIGSVAGSYRHRPHIATAGNAPLANLLEAPTRSPGPRAADLRRRERARQRADASMNDGFELRELYVAILDERPILIAQHQVVFVCALDDVESARA